METRARRYSHWVRNETVEDYSLRYAPRSFRRRTPFAVASSALGGVAYLADFAIGGSQIGEQVDFLRFMPDKTTANRRAWWASVITAGPGWVVFSVLKLFGGVFLAFYVADRVGFTKAVEPVQQYLHTTGAWLPAGALGVAVFFVVLSQPKINTTNAYSGSLSFANFFSRTPHRHPGRAIWVLLHLAIALTLMEVGIFAFLNFVLGFFSNVGIAWIGAIVADLVISKPLGLSPTYIEFKRAHL
jgi:purine-cytosine permease-like protein